MSETRDSMPSIDESDKEDYMPIEELHQSINTSKNGTLKNDSGPNCDNDMDIDDCDKSATLKAIDISSTRNENGDSDFLSNKPNGSLKSITDDMETDRFGFIRGDQYTDSNSDLIVSIEITRNREIKWQEMLHRWDDFKSKKRKKIILRCRKGIPHSMRSKAWKFLCSRHNAEATYEERTYYKEQLKHGKKLDLIRSRFRSSVSSINTMDDTMSVSTSYSATPSDWSSRDESANNHELYENFKKCTANPDVLDQIHKDIHRQFPNHDFFMEKGGRGQESLATLLTVYSIKNPETGYCQGMAPLAAALIMIMPEEDAFWTFSRICQYYIPGYYDDGLKQIQADAKTLNMLLKKENSIIYNQLSQNQIDPICYMVDWFMCVYIRTLPWPSVLQVMDMFLCEGKVILFKVALVLIIGALTVHGRGHDDQQDTDLLTVLRKLPEEITTPKYLRTNISKLSVTKTDINKEIRKQDKLIRESGKR